MVEGCIGTHVILLLHSPLESDVFASRSVRNLVVRLAFRVSEWKGSERYSIVFFSTDSRHHTHKQPQVKHTDWMERSNEQITKS
eukprot:SAG31_NODE_59_length_29571_cov_20.443506_30_plen_84_part_00